MNVKDLIVDSWSNMLKNDFILKSILVSLAYCLVFVIAIVITVIAFVVNLFLGLAATLALIIIFVPISISTTKVLLDVFQGRDAKIFGFVGYGFKNIGRIWAIIGRTFLKLLLLYVIKIALVIALIVYVASTFYNIYQDATKGITTKSLSESPLDSLTSTITSTRDGLENTLNSFDESFDSSLLTTEEGFENTLSAFDTTLDSFDFNNLESYTDSNLDTNMPAEFDELAKNLDTNAFNTNGTNSLELLGEFISQYKNQIIQSALIFVIYFIASVVIDILVIIKSLLYTYTFVLAFEDDNLTSRVAVEKSEELMRGNRAKYFWTLFLITLASELVMAILSGISQNLIMAVAVLIITILIPIYGSSYQFTFFNKLVGKNETPEVTPTDNTTTEQ